MSIRRNTFCFYVYAQSAQWLKAYISVFIGLFSKVLVFTHHQKVIKAFNCYCFTIYLKKLQYKDLIGQKRFQCPNRRKIEVPDKSAWLLPLHYLFRFTIFLLYNQLISTKKQISSLCKLYPVYEEIPEEFLDETDIDSYFYHNILDISQSPHRIVRVSKGSN